VPDAGDGLGGAVDASAVGLTGTGDGAGVAGIAAVGDGLGGAAGAGDEAAGAVVGGGGLGSAAD
jgi:hypothetical protein